MQNKTVLFTPISNLFKSRKFIVMLAGLIATILVSYVPELASNFDVIVLAIVVLAGMFIGGQSLEDALIQGRIETINHTTSGDIKEEAKRTAFQALEESLSAGDYTDEEKQILRDLLDRLLNGKK